MIVLDCSAAIGICQNIEPGLGFRALMLEGDEILAPDLFKIEIRNVMWKYVRAGLLDEKAARRGLRTRCLSLIASSQQTRTLTKLMPNRCFEDMPCMTCSMPLSPGVMHVVCLL